MAATVTLRGRLKFGNALANICDVTMGSSYPAGGEAISAAQLGLTAIDFVLPGTANGYIFQFDHVNQKLKAFAGPLTEVTGGTNLSSVTVRVLAIGH